MWLDGANIRIACCCIWLVATVWSSFPLFGWGAYVPEPYGLSCTIAWRGYHTSAKDAFYVICSFACFTLVPVVLIVVSQCQIIYKVSRFSYLLSARGIRNNLRYTEKRLSMVSGVGKAMNCNGRYSNRTIAGYLAMVSLVTYCQIPKDVKFVLCNSPMP